jgi:hypothetical protein
MDDIICKMCNGRIVGFCLYEVKWYNGVIWNSVIACPSCKKMMLNKNPNVIIRRIYE